MKKTLSTALTSLVVTVLVLAGYHFSGLGNRDVEMKPAQTETLPATFTSHFTPLPPGNLPADFTVAAAKAMPSVVHIKSLKKVSYSYNMDPFWQFFGLQPRQPQGSKQMESTGSGVIIREDGYIVTNNHVIEDADQIEVSLYDNRTYKATVIGTDPSTDLGLIHIQEVNLPAAEFANSDQVRVGEWVLAVGNPFRLSSTVTGGIVSSIGRNIELIKDRMAIESFIQTDAAVNPGNSGGALMNLEGRLIGINTAIASPTGAYAGYAFAVPSNIVGKIVDDLLRYGAVQRAYLGVTRIVNLNGKIASEAGLDRTEGVWIRELADGGSAEEAGLRNGDIIIAIDGIQVKNDGKMGEFIGRKRPGETVGITVDRDGKQKEFKVKLKNQFGTTEMVVKKKSEFLSELGLEIEALSDKELEAYGLKGGVKFSRLYAGKIREMTDIQQGFVVLRANDKDVSKPEELIRIFEDLGKVKLEGFYPGYNRLYTYSLDL